MTRYWKTSKGVLISEQVGERHALVNRQKVLTCKVKAHRYPTGGFHGWIWIENLKPLTERRARRISGARLIAESK